MSSATYIPSFAFDPAEEVGARVDRADLQLRNLRFIDPEPLSKVPPAKIVGSAILDGGKGHITGESRPLPFRPGLRMKSQFLGE